MIISWKQKCPLKRHSKELISAHANTTNFTRQQLTGQTTAEHLQLTYTRPNSCSATITGISRAGRNLNVCFNVCCSPTRMNSISCTRHKCQKPCADDSNLKDKHHPAEKQHLKQHDIGVTFVTQQLNPKNRSAIFRQQYMAE